MLEKVNLEIKDKYLELTLTINSKDYHSVFVNNYNPYLGSYGYTSKEKIDISYKIKKDFSHLTRFIIDRFIEKCIYNTDFETLQEEWSILEQGNEIFKDIYNTQMNKNRIDKQEAELYTFG